MALTVGIPREVFAGERRVAMVPNAFDRLAKVGLKMIVEGGAGAAAGFPDEEYAAKGAQIASREEVFATADIVLFVRASGEALSDVAAGKIAIGFCDPLIMTEDCAAAAEAGVTLLSMELMPRITRAQSMDALSSQATVAGYRAVLDGAAASAHMFPMLTTAAGTIAPAKVFVLGAGVAGLQAIATARRLGAVVSAYDVRPAVKEQVESVGAKFISLDVDGAGAEDKGGYAKAMDEDFYRRQREMLTRVLRDQDVVICTAAIPGKKAPLLITAEIVRAMQPGAVIVDLAAPSGGNCELTRLGETVFENGVHINGPENLASEAPYHASQMYARNIAAFLLHLAPKGELVLNLEDEITRETLVARDGRIVHPRVLANAETNNSANKAAAMAYRGGSHATV